MRRFVEEVFVTEGVPTFTFVPPPNFNDILVDIRKAGKPVIVEGQSGTGKTTCVKKILEQLDADNVQYLTARIARDVSRIEELLATPRVGTFVIDDFHRLAKSTQDGLANFAKAAAEGEDGLPKLVLIGINEMGSGLIQLVPDIQKRLGIHKIRPGAYEDINLLVTTGCRELNVTFLNVEAIFKESAGDYWLTQQLCQQLCKMQNVTETVNDNIELSFDVTALRARTVEVLKAGYYPAIKDFCRGRRFRPSNDPYFKLLRTVGEQPNSIVDLNELAASHAEVRGSINNIKGQLKALLEAKPTCARYFYYNEDTKHFAIEDPALFYFIKHLNWDEARQECGFRATNKDYEFDIAISFAGENRELARYLAEQLSNLDIRVFYDENYESNYLGKTWTNEFRRIFSTDRRADKSLYPFFL